MNLAATAWGFSGSPVTAGELASSQNVVRLVNLGLVTRGRYIPNPLPNNADPGPTPPPGPNVTRFVILMNYHRINNEVQQGSEAHRRIIQSVFAHELGHAFGLEDASYTNSIMHTGRDRSELFLPTPHDRESISWLHQ